MFARTLLLPMLWSALLLAALVVYPLVARLGTAIPPAGLSQQTFVPPPGKPADPRSSARATPLGYAAAVSGPSAHAPDGFEHAVEQEVFRLTNAQRQLVHAAPLTSDPDLVVTARAHSRDMIDRGFFDHITPEGLTPSDRVAGIHRTLIGNVGENIYKQTGPTTGTAEVIAKKVVDALIASLGHRENIERATYTHLGAGVVWQGSTLLVTQVFADAAAFLVTPLPVRVRSQNRLDLSVRQATALGSPRQFGLFRPDRGVLAFGPFDLGQPPVVADPGLYRLVMIFATFGRGSTYPGPDFEVVR